MCQHTSAYLTITQNSCFTLPPSTISALRKAELSLNGNAYQRPNYKGNFADNEITLHDAVMMDDPNREEQLDKIHHDWQLAQSKENDSIGTGFRDLHVSDGHIATCMLTASLYIWPMNMKYFSAHTHTHTHTHTHSSPGLPPPPWLRGSGWYDGG